MRYRFLVGVILLAVLLIGCRHQSNKVFTLGVIANLEGRNANTDGLRAVQMALDVYHKDHPRSAKIDLLSMDDSWNAEKCRQAYRQLQPKCDFFFLQTTSTAFMAVYPDIQQNASVLHLTVGPATTEISGKADNVVRNNLDTAKEQESIADFLNRQGRKHLLILTECERNVAYTESAIKFFRQYFKGDIQEVRFSADHFDLTEAMSAFHNTDFDQCYILTGGTPAEAGVIVQSIHREKPEMPIITSPWVRSQFFIEAVGPYGENVVVPEFTLMSPKNKPYMKFIADFRKRFHTEPGYTAFYTYDLAMAFLDALQRTNSTDAAKLLKTMVGRDYNGVNGKFRFSETGDIEANLHFYRLNGAGYEIIE